MVAELDSENAICLRPLNDQIVKQRTAVQQQQLHPSCLVSQAVDEEDRGLEGILEPRIPVTEILTMTTKIRVPTFNSETDDYLHSNFSWKFVTSMNKPYFPYSFKAC